MKMLCFFLVIILIFVFLMVVEAAMKLVVDEVIDIDAVSYTHLRAHETVLDLVCRLLHE